MKSLSTTKPLYVKSVKADGDSGIEVALLDGGATHALRQAKPSELGDLRPVEVEMAVGKVTLHKVPYQLLGSWTAGGRGFHKCLMISGSI